MPVLRADYRLRHVGVDSEISGGVLGRHRFQALNPPLFPMNSAVQAGQESGRLLALHPFTKRLHNRGRLISLAAAGCKPENTEESIHES